MKTYAYLLTKHTKYKTLQNRLGLVYRVQLINEAIA